MYEAVQQFVNDQEWVGGIEGPLQSYVGSLFTNAGPAGKSLKNVLNGSWLGHPLHPVLTDVPVGAWTTTFVLDTAGAISGDPGIQSAADISLATGLAAAIGSAATGFTDWSDTYGKERRVGLLHGMLMVAATMTYALSLLARVTGKRKTGVVLSNSGLVLMSTGSYLGGDEVFDIGYGVNHAAFEHGPSDYTQVMRESDLEDGKPTKVEASGVPIMIVKQGTRVYALCDTCVHAGCSLSGGKLEGETIICPCHGSQYRLANGSVVNGPATRPEPSYDVRSEEGMVEVRVASA